MIVIESDDIHWRDMARLAGLEPATLEFEARYSIQLSYKRTIDNSKLFNNLLQAKI